MTVLYLARHGETDANTRRAYNGCAADDPLNAAGRAEAAALAEGLKHVPFDGIYVSAAHRARETAAPLCEALHLTPVVREDLREADFGDWNTLTKAEIAVKWPTEWADWHALPRADFTFPNGDRFGDFYALINRAVGDIVRKNKGKTILIVSHKMALQMALLGLFSLPPEAQRRLPQLSNTGVGRIEIEDNGVFRITTWNDVAHLKAAGITPVPAGDTVDPVLSESDFFAPHWRPFFLPDDKTAGTAALAYLGDSVLETRVRAHLLSLGLTSAKALNARALDFVRAGAQAAAMARILPHLTEAEAAVFHRGRNAGHTRTPKGATVAEYRAATGMEALFGYLALTGSEERISRLFALGYLL